jgi:DNA-directed RNA polymerase alpha subunit
VLDPAPELPNDTSISGVELSTRIRNALDAAGLKTVGAVREASDATLLSLYVFLGSVVTIPLINC